MKCMEGRQDTDNVLAFGVKAGGAGRAKTKHNLLSDGEDSLLYTECNVLPVLQFALQSPPSK